MRILAIVLMFFVTSTSAKEYIHFDLKNNVVCNTEKQIHEVMTAYNDLPMAESVDVYLKHYELKTCEVNYETFIVPIVSIVKRSSKAKIFYIVKVSVAGKTMYTGYTKP